MASIEKKKKKQVTSYQEVRDRGGTEAGVAVSGNDMETPCIEVFHSDWSVPKTYLILHIEGIRRFYCHGKLGKNRKIFMYLCFWPFW